jgi:hypothetical protein
VALKLLHPELGLSLAPQRFRRDRDCRPASSPPHLHGL